MVKQIKTIDELNASISEAGDKLVVIDFYATWCGPCKRIAPILEVIAEELKDKMVLLKVDVDETDELVSEYKIEVMPTFVFLQNGKHLDSLTGSNEQKLRELIAKHTK